MDVLKEYSREYVSEICDYLESELNFLGICYYTVRLHLNNGCSLDKKQRRFVEEVLQPYLTKKRFFSRKYFIEEVCD